MNRRNLLAGGISLAAVGAAVGFSRNGVNAAESGAFEIVKTDAEWQEVLSPAQFAVLRKEATERPWTSPLLDEKRKGVYTCGGCELPLYASETKFDSGTGWPSFFAALDNAVGTTTDYKLLLPRTEVHCRRCGGHLGHIFNDGPPPTGKRHCINGLAMGFVPA